MIVRDRTVVYAAACALAESPAADLDGIGDGSGEDVS
jgi:hypothetical protein